MNKEDLEKQVKVLQAATEQAKVGLNMKEEEMNELRRNLAKINTPRLSETQVDELCITIQESLEGLEYNNNDMNFEFEIDWDNRISVTNFDLDDMKVNIMKNIEEILAEFFETEENDG